MLGVASPLCSALTLASKACFAACKAACCFRSCAADLERFVAACSLSACLSCMERHIIESAQRYVSTLLSLDCLGKLLYYVGCGFPKTSSSFTFCLWRCCLCASLLRNLFSSSCLNGRACLRWCGARRSLTCSPSSCDTQHIQTRLRHHNQHIHSGWCSWRQERPTAAACPEESHFCLSGPLTRIILSARAAAVARKPSTTSSACSGP